MQFSLDTDKAGRFICTLTEGTIVTTVTASNVPAAGNNLLDALESVQATGLGECWWEEQGGDYRWLFRRDGDRLTVAVMWSAGTLTGWQHVFRAECDLEWFAGRVRGEFERIRAIV